MFSKSNLAVGRVRRQVRLATNADKKLAYNFIFVKLISNDIYVFSIKEHTNAEF